MSEKRNISIGGFEKDREHHLCSTWKSIGIEPQQHFFIDFGRTIQRFFLQELKAEETAQISEFAYGQAPQVFGRKPLGE
jgi:hypothetical protein